MKTPALLVGLVLLAAGFGAGYLVGSDSSGEPTGGGPLVVDDDAPAADRPADLLTAAASAPALDAQGDVYGLRAAIDRVPVPPAPVGDGEITGSVRVVNGPPIEGAQVTASPKPPEDLAPYRKDMELHEILERTVLLRRWREQAERETVTGAGGTFRLDGIADLEYSVKVEHGDYRSTNRPREARQAKAGAQLDFTMEAQARVTVSITRPDGTSPERAMVKFASGRRSRSTSWSPSRPEVTMSPGSYSVSVTAGADDEYKAEPQELTLEIGVPATLDFHLKGNPGIRGRVVQAEGERWEWPVVYAARLAPGVERAASLLGGDFDRARQMEHLHRTDRYRFKDLRPGRYLVGAGRGDNQDVVAMEVVEVRDDVVELDLELPPIEREAYAIVRAFGPDGRPLTHPAISTGYFKENGSSSGGSSHLARPDGSFWVLHHRSGIGTDPKGSYWIQIDAGPYGTLRETYKLGRAVELTFRFQASASLEVEVSGVSGTRYEGRVRVSVTPEAEDGNPNPSMAGQPRHVGESGSLTVKSLQPGRYKVALTIGERHWGMPVGEKRVTVGGGENKVSLALPRLHVVTFEGASGHLFVRSDEKGGGHHRSMRVGDDGRAVMEGLPDGTYTVHSGEKTKEFTLPGSTAIDLR